MPYDRIFCTLFLAAAAGSVTGSGAMVEWSDPYSDLPESITLTGICRDFRERETPGGHPDMELSPPRGYGHYMGITQDELDAEGKPVFASNGFKVTTQFRDAQGRNIIGPKAYLTARAGDVAGACETTPGRVVTSADRFGQWFRDVPGVNLSRAISIVLEREEGTNEYVYDDRLDTRLASGEGFFIVNDQLYGNSQGGNKNFHFTYEIATEFIFERDQGQVFSFNGDDDVFVFIDGKLVADIGGLHDKVWQTIELDRCAWLQDGQTYSLRFFFAERHRPSSNFRIETTLNLRSVELPSVSALFD